MKILIQSPHITISETLTKFVNLKLDKLSRFYARIETAEVFLKIEKSDLADDKVCEIRLFILGNDLFVKKQGNSFEAAITYAIYALHGEIDKVKIRFQHQH
ncbi:MAG: ribosome-associated translation inhibitor RaiA [Saprospiraceae bacterium]